MLVAKLRTLRVSALVLVAAMSAPTPCEAGPLLDWLWGRFRRTPAPQQAPVSNVSFCAPQPTAGACNTCQRTVVNYAPQTTFHTSWVRVPVTVYRPVTTQDPVTCCRVTVMQPCTSYTWQARRVPQTVYRPFLSRVTHVNPCCGVSAGFAGSGTIMSPDFAGPAFATGAPIGGSYVQQASGVEAPASFGGGFFDVPGANATAPAFGHAAPAYAAPYGNGTTVPGAGSMQAPVGDPGAQTVPAPGSTVPADTRPSLNPNYGGYDPSLGWSTPPSNPSDWAGSSGANGDVRLSRPTFDLRPGEYGSAAAPHALTPIPRGSASELSPAKTIPNPAANGSSNLLGPLPIDERGAIQPHASPKVDAPFSNPYSLQPILDPDADNKPSSSKEPFGDWPEAPPLFDPSDRSASRAGVQGAWGSVPAAWPENQARSVAAHGTPTNIGLPVSTASQARSMSPDQTTSQSAAIRQPISTTVNQPAPRGKGDPSTPSAPGVDLHRGWRSADSSR